MNKQKQRQSLLGKVLSFIVSGIAIAFVFVGEQIWDYLMQYGGAAYFFPLIGGSIIWLIAGKFIKPELSIEELWLVAFQGGLAFSFIASMLIIQNDVSIDGILIVIGLFFFILKRSTLLPLFLLCAYNFYLFILNITRIIEYSWNSPESKGLWTVLLITGASLISAYFVVEERKEKDNSSTPKNSNRKTSNSVKRVGLFVLFTSIGIVGWIGWSNYQKKLPQKTIEDLFTYLDAGEYEKAYYQYSSKFHDIYDMTPEFYVNSFEGTSNHTIVSIETIEDNSLINKLTLNTTLGVAAQDLSFQDYRSKRLFKVQYYGEDPKKDMKVYEEEELYCSTPGIFVDAYFGAVQLDAFNWEILFWYPLNLECKGQNKYHAYKKAEEEKRRRKEAQEKREYNIQRLKLACDMSFFMSYQEAHGMSPYSKEFMDRLEKTKEKECSCIAERLYVLLPEKTIDAFLLSYWADDLGYERGDFLWRQLVRSKPRYFFNCGTFYSL